MKEIEAIKKERLLYFLLILSIFIFSGCIGSNNGKNEVEWDDEILLAKECGMDRLRCCSDDPACFYGQTCCTDPSDNKRNYCANDCELGKEEAFCRKDEPRCNSGTACVDDFCLLCGGENQPCCEEDNKCGNDLLCYKDKCVKCGSAGNPCCGNTKACEHEDKIDYTHTECRSGVCVYCGNNGKVSCISEPYCLTGHLLNNDVCLKCGEANLPCCDKDDNGYECNEDKNLTCELGFCSKK
ncbi:hypothetical protein DRH27_05040 [Candidatus Falkowbacteria bacterium]|nr:MAG: hypothetical protein DRH27_05040 [Candidatus Falkowbacteria bacterium]